MLQKEGINVREASNGREAIDVLQSGVKPDLIVLDLIMAEMDGFDFLRQVRPHAEWSKIPVVVVSSLDLNSEAQEVLRGQVERIFQKGRFAREDLLREVRETINQHMLKRQSASQNPVPKSS
jgi:CheY-like chemotaxis protein